MELEKQPFKRKHVLHRASSGFIQLIIIIILSVIILSLLGVSISSLLNNKTLRENFATLWDWTMWVWNNFLKEYTIATWRFIKTKIDTWI